MGDCEIGEVMRACGWKASESELKVGEDEILILSHSEYDQTCLVLHHNIWYRQTSSKNLSLYKLELLLLLLLCPTKIDQDNWFNAEC